MQGTSDPGLDPLVGGWRLESVGVTFSDTGERVDFYGPDPDGHMVLEPNGRIMFLFTKSNRKTPTSDADRAGLFNDMTAYTGMVRLDGPGRFITSVDLAWNPAWQGEQLRFFTLDGDRLTIRSPEQTHPRTGDRLWVAELVWTRERPTAASA
jgi:hypothetical protein